MLSTVQTERNAARKKATDMPTLMKETDEAEIKFLEQITRPAVRSSRHPGPEEGRRISVEELVRQQPPIVCRQYRRAEQQQQAPP